MTGIKPTVSLFRVWQRELNGVLTHFSTTYTLYYCGYALALPWSSCYSRHVTQCDCDCDMTICDPPSQQLWHCDKVMWYFPVLHLVVVNKKRKKKRNINNDLANLPSHDTITMWLCSLTPMVSWLLCHMLWLWLWPFCDCCHAFVILWLVM